MRLTDVVALQDPSAEWLLDHERARRPDDGIEMELRLVPVEDTLSAVSDGWDAHDWAIYRGLLEAFRADPESVAPVVYLDGLLADGFHRMSAAHTVGLATIRAYCERRIDVPTDQR